MCSLKERIEVPPLASLCFVFGGGNETEARDVEATEGCSPPRRLSEKKRAPERRGFLWFDSIEGGESRGLSSEVTRGYFWGY